MTTIKLIEIDNTGSVTEVDAPPVQKVKAMAYGLDRTKVEAMIRAKQREALHGVEAPPPKQP